MDFGRWIAPIAPPQNPMLSIVSMVFSISPEAIPFNVRVASCIMLSVVFIFLASKQFFVLAASAHGLCLG